MNRLEDYARGGSDYLRHEQLPLLDTEHGPPTEILDNLTSFTGGEYGADTPFELMDEFMHGVMMSPEKAHVLFAGGEPGSGKSTILYQMAARMFLPYDYEEETIIEGSDDSVKTTHHIVPPLRQFAEMNGYTIRIHMFPWGDASEYPGFPQDWKVDRNLDYHASPDLLAKKQQEVVYVEEIDRRAFHTSVKAANERVKQGKKEINIVLGDVPFNTGTEIDGQPVGVLRARNFMYDLMHHEGDMAELDYESSFFTVSGSNAVREKAMNDRQILTDKSLTEEERSAILEAKGMHITTDTPVDVETIVRESAPPSEMRLIEKDVELTLVPMWQQHDPTVRPRYYGPGEVDREAFETPDFRTKTIGTVQLPRLIREVTGLDASSRRVGNFYNEIVAERSDVYPGLVDEHPIATMRDEIIQSILEREKAEQDAKVHRPSVPIVVYERPVDTHPFT